MNYIELGVMDPIGASNTYYFYLLGASGILVEANPKLIDRISSVRNRDIVINKAVYAGEGDKVRFYISEDVGLSSVLSDHIDGVPEWEVHPIVEEIEVDTISINDVFSMSKSDVDLLSIDIEGYDYYALQELNFDIYRPKIIISELNYTHKKGVIQYQKIVDLLYDMGYVLYAHNQYNGIFCDKSIIEKM